MAKETAGNSADYEKAKSLYLKGRVDEAFPMIKIAASQGVAEAMYLLGEYFSQGYGHTTQDFKKGLMWRKKGAEAGNILAKLNATFTPKCSEKRRQETAKELLPQILEMSSSGDILAQNELADMYLYGFGTPEDLDSGMHWLKMAADAGFWRPLNKLGEMYWDPNTPYYDIEKARACFKKAAGMGYGPAEMNLGVMYFFEKPKRVDLCIWYVKRSYAHGGEAAGDAAAFLDELYSFSGAVPQDPVEGLSWAKRSIDLGSGRGMRNMGTHYNDGNGVPQDADRAIEWYRKSAETGFLNGKVAYGIALRSRNREEEAAEQFRQAASMGDTTAMVWYASCFLYGIGKEKNRNIGQAWLMSAANRGNEEAARLLKEEFPDG